LRLQNVGVSFELFLIFSSQLRSSGEIALGNNLNNKIFATCPLAIIIPSKLPNPSLKVFKILELEESASALEQEADELDFKLADSE
jgi:hypothetical protein